MSIGPEVFAALAEGRAFIDVLDVDAPAAGANASLPNERGLARQVLAASATLTTDANVANRVLALDYIGRSGLAYVRNADAVAEAASNGGRTYHWRANLGLGAWGSVGDVHLPLLSILLPPQIPVQLTVASIQATDQLSAIRFIVLHVKP